LKYFSYAVARHKLAARLANLFAKGYDRGPKNFRVFARPICVGRPVRL
jgi:hypothetical protein